MIERLQPREKTEEENRKINRAFVAALSRELLPEASPRGPRHSPGCHIHDTKLKTESNAELREALERRR